ncbi:MAG: hypothetical protein AB7R90_11885 [Reyranellaceae bacterium]
MSRPFGRHLSDSPPALPSWFGRWLTILAVAGPCGWAIWSEATMLTDRLTLGIFALALLALGAILLVAALVHALRRRLAVGALVALGIVAATFCLVMFELPSQALDRYRLWLYGDSANRVLLGIRAANPDASPVTSTRFELGTLRGEQLVPPLSQARLYVYPSAGGRAGYALRIDSIECSLDADGAQAECRPLERSSK